MGLDSLRRNGCEKGLQLLMLLSERLISRLQSTLLLRLHGDLSFQLL
jgi:hypothetical protein